MAVPTTSWSETSPAGSDPISAGDDRIRELKTQVREVIAVDHSMESSGNPDTNGQHKQMTLQEAADIGSGSEGVPILGAQTIDDRPELVYTTEDDDDVQLTEDAKVGGTTQDAIFADVTATSISVKNTTNSACGFVPIGGIIPWLKNLTGAPALPANFVECNGQLLSDADSVFDDVTIPNLNGNNNFLRGNSTSGDTGGEATTADHTHSVVIPESGWTWIARSALGYLGISGTASDNDDGQNGDRTLTSGAGGTHTNLPPYYGVVWIIRIK